MGTEDNGGGTGSMQDPAANSKTNEELTLAARRRALRGTLNKQVTASNPYQASDYGAQDAAGLAAAASAIDPASATAYPSDDEFMAADEPEVATATAADANWGNLPQPAQQQEHQSAGVGYSFNTAVPTAGAVPGASVTASMSMLAPPVESHDEPNAGAVYQAFNQSRVPAQSDEPEYAAMVPEEQIGEDPVAAVEPPPAAPVEAMPVAEPSPAPATRSRRKAEPDDSSMKSESPETSSSEVQNDDEPVPSEPGVTRGKRSARESKGAPVYDPPVPQIPNTPPLTPLPVVDRVLQQQAVEVLNNIDQAMGTCAMNLSSLQKIGTEQTDALKTLAETMQSQNFFEIGLNLNSIIESMSAALEPMKAVGELVPAIDQLVVALESRDSGKSATAAVERLSPDQLVMNLADQLSSGQIDPWTFKRAYVALFPGDEPTALVQRLVDLLGTQRLSGDVFKTATEAIESSTPPSVGEVRTIEKEVIKVVQDESLISQISALQKANQELQERSKASEATGHSDVRIDELQSIVSQLQEKLSLRETESSEQIATKDRELKEAQDLITSRWEEFNARYDELTEVLHKRDDLIAEKEAELTRKETENQQLKAQLEELRDQYKDTVAEMQKQLMAAAKPKEEAPKQGNFFDPAPGAAQQGAQQTLFEPAQSRPLFQPGQQQSQQAVPQQQQTQPQQQQSQQMAPQQQTQPQQQAPAMAPPVAPHPQSAAAQAIPRPAATTPFLTGGSYGSGVRAQVFEVIVRQALAGAPWREICAGPMTVNNISAEEVEAEVKRRQALLKK